MTRNTEQFPNNEPQSAAEQAQLEHIESLLAMVAARQAVPAGLVDRVYRASAGLLNTAVLAGPWSPSVGSVRSTPGGLQIRVRSSMWSRLALAASVALALLAARPLMVAHQSQPLSSNMVLAMLDSGSDRDEVYLETMGIFDVRAGDVLDDVTQMLQGSTTDK